MAGRRREDEARRGSQGPSPSLQAGFLQGHRHARPPLSLVPRPAGGGECGEMAFVPAPRASDKIGVSLPRGNSCWKRHHQTLRVQVSWGSRPAAHVGRRIPSRLWRLRVQVRGVSRLALLGGRKGGSGPGLPQILVAAGSYGCFLACVTGWRPPRPDWLGAALCPNVPFLSGHQSYVIRAPDGLIETCFLCKDPHPKLGDRHR